MIGGALLVSSFGGCTQAEAKLESTVSEYSHMETETAEVEEPIIRTLFSQPLKTEYQKAFDTYNKLNDVIQKMKDTYTAATDKENVVVVPVIGDETLQDELKATEEAAESLGKKVPRDNDESYIMWREGAEESLLEQAQAAYDTWLAEQKAAEAAKKAEEEAKAEVEAVPEGLLGVVLEEETPAVLQEAVLEVLQVEAIPHHPVSQVNRYSLANQVVEGIQIYPVGVMRVVLE